jgi:trimethylamine corrinoid protein
MLLSELGNNLKHALLTLDRDGVQTILSDAMRESSSLSSLEDLLVMVLEDIGKQWEEGEVALAQIYMAGRICEEVLDTILPSESIISANHHHTIGLTVLEDPHLLGKRIVSSVLKVAGIEVHDLGRQTVNSLVKQVKQHQISLLLISTLMLPSALRIKEVTKQLPDVSIIVGGAPFIFDKHLWKEVGADAVGVSASDAVKLVKSFTGTVE